jgi:CheY-like chemotaxis protein
MRRGSLSRGARPRVQRGRRCKVQKILLVEDEVVIAIVLGQILEEEGYDVVLAADGADGLTKAIEENPDLIVADYMMPRMSGTEMIGELRREGRGTPAILVTAISEEQVGAEDPRHVYDAYLRKPFDDGELVNLVHSILDEDKH